MARDFTRAESDPDAELERRMRDILRRHRQALEQSHALGETSYLAMIHELLLLFVEVALSDR